jgi:ribonuclease G
LLYDRMMENMKNDRSRHNSLPLSKFCLMQITRQRVRPVLDIDVEEECPSCFGTGKIRPSILFTDTLEEKIKSVKFDHNISSFRLHVHPYVAAYINKGIYSLKWKWKLTYGMGIHIVADQSMAFLQYMFKDSHGNEIDVTEEKDLKTPSKKKKDTKETNPEK